MEEKRAMSYALVSYFFNDLVQCPILNNSLSSVSKSFNGSTRSKSKVMFLPFHLVVGLGFESALVVDGCTRFL